MYRVHLESFQGPMDLLLFFIRRDEIDIYDIPIAHITREFMDTLDQARALNISVAGEFINMAATLMQIKSRMMLPHSLQDDLGDNVDPRTELVQQLLEYQRYKELAVDFRQLESSRRRFFPRSDNRRQFDSDEDPGVYLREISLYDLARRFKQAMDAMPVITSYDLRREPINLDDQKAILISSFNSEGRLLFTDLIKKLNSKLEVIVTFMALLELVRLNQIKLLQRRIFGDLEMLLIVHQA